MQNNKTLFYLTFSLFLLAFSCREGKIEPFRSGTIRGQVLFAEDLSPLKDVTIKTNPATSSILTDENGNFTLYDIPVGSYSIQAEKTDYLTKFESISVSEDVFTEVTIKLSEIAQDNYSPTQPASPSPADNATDQPLTVVFRWSSTDQNTTDELTYKLTLIDTRSGQRHIFDDLKQDSLIMEDLVHNTLYTWQVVVSDGVNPEVAGPLWSFNTVPFPQGHEYWFVRMNDQGNHVIYSAKEDGRDDELVQLTPSDRNCWSPQVNTALGKIAYISDYGNKNYVYLMNLDGTQVERLTETVQIRSIDNFEIQFCWSPDNNHLIFMDFNRLYKVSINSNREVTELARAPTNYNFFSCDARYINLTEQRIAVSLTQTSPYDREIHLLDGDGELVEILVPNAPGMEGAARLSHDGKEIVYAYDPSGFESANQRPSMMHIFVMNLGTKTTEDISALGNFDNFLETSPRFSPEGAHIIFTRTPISQSTSTQSTIYKMKNRGETRELLFENAKMIDWQRL